MRNENSVPGNNDLDKTITVSGGLILTVTAGAVIASERGDALQLCILFGIILAIIVIDGAHENYGRNHY